MASSPSSSSHSANPRSVYSVEHLATFSKLSPTNTQTTPKIALERLFAMEKTSGIWTQRMSIAVEGHEMKIIDGDSGETVERFPVSLIQHPTAFNHANHIYDNILIFTVSQAHPTDSSSSGAGELHIFQCNSHSAQQVVDELSKWMRRHGNVHVNSTSNSHVKEAVHAFNAIAREREVTKSTSPTVMSPTGSGSLDSSGDRHHHNHSNGNNTTPSGNGIHHTHHHRNGSTSDQSLSNERYVSILNHCFDDIERFIIRLQHSAAALRELQIRQQNRRKGGKNSSGHESGDGLLAVRARGPAEEEFFEIMSKFKLAFNLLAKLKGCIHDPNAPELVHFLFTPLAIIIEAARSNHPLPVDPCVVGIPFLNLDSIELLRNCCTSKEYDLWQSLGINWTQPVKEHLATSRLLPVTFQPVFCDGWAPSITEPDLIGFASDETCDHHDHRSNLPLTVGGTSSKVQRVYDDSEGEDNGVHRGHHNNHFNNNNNRHRGRHSSSPSPIESEESPLEGDLDSPSMNVTSVDLEQAEWLQELSARNAKVVRVLFPRSANNDKELSVSR